ncbi:MAG: PAS domain-containing protein, partial [Rhizobacter sp.]|nr:PAS domain-containing protein [Rhizobacter sp.]
MRIAYVDRDKRYQFVNLAQCRRFGRDRAQILGRTRQELAQGTSDEAVAPRIDTVLSGQAQRFEYEELVGSQVRRLETQLLPDIAESG